MTYTTFPLKEYENTSCVFENFIATFPNFMSNEYCQSLINAFHKNLDSGFGYVHHKDIERNDTVVFASQSKLTSEPRDFLDAFWKKAYKDYAKKYSILDVADKHGIFGVKIQKSELGDGFHNWHFDNCGPENHQRILVFILYLNDVEDGGETEFLYIPKRVKPEAGKLVIFPAGFTHSHRGNPPITNTKYILTGWLEY